MNAPEIRSQSTLHVEQLVFGYPDRPLFDGLSADFANGVTWLRGANGSGKSTLLKILAGALAPQGGRLNVRGVRLDADSLAYRHCVFWCGPGPIPFDHLTPLDYFGFIRSLYPALDQGALARHVAGFGLLPYLAQPLRTLSTGTQRKVWLSAAFSVHTPVVLLDEPLNALDAASQRYAQAVLDSWMQLPAQLCLVASHEPIGGGEWQPAVFDLISAQASR